MRRISQTNINMHRRIYFQLHQERPPRFFKSAILSPICDVSGFYREPRNTSDYKTPLQSQNVSDNPQLRVGFFLLVFIRSALFRGPCEAPGGTKHFYWSLFLVTGGCEVTEMQSQLFQSSEAGVWMHLWRQEAAKRGRTESQMRAAANSAVSTRTARNHLAKGRKRRATPPGTRVQNK